MCYFCDKIKDKNKYLFQMYTVNVYQENKLQLKNISEKYFTYEILSVYK